MLTPDEKFIVYQIFAKHAVGNDTPRWQWLECTKDEHDAAPYAPHGMDMRTRRKLAILPAYHITARTWCDRSGTTEYVAELRSVDSANVMFTITGHGSGSAWEYEMRDAMHHYMPSTFPDSERNSPTRYFREVCNVPYDCKEVARKSHL